MDLQQAINDLRINVFDITPLMNGDFYLKTYAKPGEDGKTSGDRHNKNVSFAKRLLKN